MNLFIFILLNLNFYYFLRSLESVFNLLHWNYWRCVINQCITRTDSQSSNSRHYLCTEATVGSSRATRLIGAHEAQITYATTCGWNRNAGVRFRRHRLLRRQPEKLIEQRVITAANNHAGRLHTRTFRIISYLT